MPTLRRLFRSKDPDALKYNIRTISDEILEKHHAPKVEPTPVSTPVNTPVEPPKPAIPVIGKQITSNTVGNTAQTLKTRADWNRYLQEHPKGI
jgi:hypothetical protein